MNYSIHLALLMPHICLLLLVNHLKAKKTIVKKKNLYLSEKLQFFGNSPQNTSVEWGEEAVLNCSVQTNDPTIKIRWLKKINSTQKFRPDAIVIGSEEFEIFEQSQEHELEHHSNKIVSRPLIFSSITSKEVGQYLCLIQNDQTTNYRKAFINVIKNSDSESKSNDV